MAATLVVGDFGKNVDLSVVDEDGAAVTLTGGTLTIHLKKPGGTVLSKSATAVGSIARYALVTGDIDEAGIWQAQLQYILSGENGRSSIVEFPVEQAI